jgi:hypothetical protein
MSLPPLANFPSISNHSLVAEISDWLTFWRYLDGMAFYARRYINGQYRPRRSMPIRESHLTKWREELSLPRCIGSLDRPAKEEIGCQMFFPAVMELVQRRSEKFGGEIFEKVRRRCGCGNLPVAFLDAECVTVTISVA